MMRPNLMFGFEGKTYLNIASFERRILRRIFEATKIDNVWRKICIRVEHMFEELDVVPFKQ